MPEIQFTNLLIVVAAAFLAPLLLGLAPSLRMPAVVLEIVFGIVIGPSVLGWVEVDEPVEVMSLVGLAFLLFLAGLEIDLKRLRGHSLRVAGLGFAASLALALAIAFLLEATGQVQTPLLVAIILASTALGIIVPALKDQGEASSGFGQLIIAAASIADFGTIILLSLFFSREATGTDTKLILLGGFALLVAVVALALLSAEHSKRISKLLVRLQDTTAQIRVRGAFVLLIAFVALAENLGLEVILGAFVAGAILSLIDRDQSMTHPRLHAKLEGAGYGIFIPIFFVASGVSFDLSALVASASTVALVPIFLLALLAARGLPALLYRRTIGTRKTVAAALLQATSLPFIVAATAIGIEQGLIDEAASAAMIAAGLLSVLVFPLAAATVLRGEAVTGDAADAPAER